jgi:hypothetical protein
MQHQFARPTGPGASVVKYDVITALSILALRENQTVQTTVLRLIALMTARYNWKSDHVSVPQADMARMWNVSERTVKREIKRMVATGLIVCVRPGVRGRVGAYRLNYKQVCERTRGCWEDVGCDYDTRMRSMGGAAEAKVVKVDFSTKTLPLPEPSSSDDLWGNVLHALRQTDPANLHNWYMKLQVDAVGDDLLSLRAPSGFVAQYVQTHLAAALEKAVATVLRKRVTIEIMY